MSLAQFGLAQAATGLAGGLLIGVAAAIMLLGAGRIAGVSGIAARATGIGGGTMPLASAWSFLAGLSAGAAVSALALGLPQAEFGSWPVLVAAGLLVGIGTRLGSGCTSGHGVCGVSRLSRRSIVATATFMAAGVATVALSRLIGVAQ